VKGIAAYNMMGRQPILPTQQLLYCNNSLVSVLLGVGFGRRDLQTLPRQTSFLCGFLKEEFIRITHEAWRNWNTILNRRLPTITQKYFEKSHKTH
jgi:hypothetical protein